MDYHSGTLVVRGGSVNSPKEVIHIYADGGRNIVSGPDRGEGRLHQFYGKRISGFSITREEEKDLINFLCVLTDSTVLGNHHFANSWRMQL
ncbi:hypothetical protein [Dyadobacter frigoris]|uniref:Cytochrome c domain-containing protein n=1 Tax=Dyadobacter frigoris TaxID=2576211 RepID=A0A4U6DC26_9BACT|nr:hypothetical protein [Dyadobacter frigoris]TKT94031.1 hypothetical protein FDK13_02140 [Dyadobacter frigoris]GLU50745.1 hypothetical protein Dfri01_02060 [Dyadobacter frigoris]